MLDTFKISFRLKNAYRTNSILYSIKQLPIIKKLLPDALYSNRALKTFANILSGIVEFVSVFLGKGLYMFLMILLAASYMKVSRADAVLHIFFFLTILGGLLNTNILDPTKDKYYALILMRMDAKDYALSNYCYFLLKILIGFLPFTLIIGTTTGINFGICLLMPIYVVAVKLIASALLLRSHKHSKRAKSKNIPDPIVWLAVTVLLAVAYLPPLLLGITINSTILIACATVAAVAAVFAGNYIFSFQNYRCVYKEILTENAIISLATGNIEQTAMQKKIDLATNVSSKLDGYQYFNELFMKRHGRILMKSAKRITVICVALVLVALLLCTVNSSIKTQMNDLMLTFLPYFLFIMYIINRGQVVTKAMFMNCDHSMLSYRFYRQPQVILGLFTERLKSVIKINLLPASVIALGLPLILLYSGGTNNPLNYFSLFLSIIAMSVFFSVHYLVLYYLLQPYNINIEMKSSTYSVISGLTYFVCYFAIGKQVSTLIFGITIIAFSILYVIIALILVYRYAPKTFKLKA